MFQAKYGSYFKEPITFRLLNAFLLQSGMLLIKNKYVFAVNKLQNPYYIVPS